MRWDDNAMGSTLQDPGNLTAAQKAQFVRLQLPKEGLFAGQQWRISPNPLPLSPKDCGGVEYLGPHPGAVLWAVNLLYRQSLAGKEPGWVVGLVGQGQAGGFTDLAASRLFQGRNTAVIRPDLLVLDGSLAITELDSVPGGIGLTAWLNQVYSQLVQGPVTSPVLDSPSNTFRAQTV